MYLLDPLREVALPTSVVSLFKGDPGLLYDGSAPGVSIKMLKLGEGESPRARCHPDNNLPDMDRVAARSETECGMPQHQIVSYLMYPKVTRKRSGPPSEKTATYQCCLPGPVFNFGTQLRRASWRWRSTQARRR